jgi:hypothetical protein
MNTFESLFHELAQHLRVQPHRHTWERIRAKLDVHRSHRKVIHSRFLMLAAAGLIVVVTSLAVFLFTAHETRYAVAYSRTIEDLAPAQATSESGIFDVASIRRSYADIKQ